ncbi:MAG: hypothetical protein FWC56_00130, partial [Phycisphaerae bacterium]|nr:hypothetical protein [Phycisphaerae bacterium]
MAQIYSIQRPGRPRLTIAMNALLLLLACGAAKYVIAPRTASYANELSAASLGEPQLMKELGLSVRLPQS